jgi:hypothetical protein
MTANDFTTLQTASLIDHLCTAVDEARAKLAQSNDPNAPAWLRAIDAAWGRILEADTLRYRAKDHALCVASASEAGKTYTANGACQCAAFVRSGHRVCWHRAAARLVRRAVELQAASRVQHLSQRITIARRQYLA